MNRPGRRRSPGTPVLLISATDVIAVDRGGSIVGSRDLEGWNDRDGEWRSLREAVGELLPDRGSVGRIDVILMPPLAHLRLLEVSDPRSPDAQDRIARSVDRYFPQVSATAVVAIQPLPRQTAKGHNVLVGVADRRTVDEVRHTVMAQRYDPRVRIGESAWLEGIAALAPDVYAGVVEFSKADGTPLLTWFQLDEGHLQDLRRVPVSATATLGPMQDVDADHDDLPGRRSASRAGSVLFFGSPEGHRLLAESSGPDLEVFRSERDLNPHELAAVHGSSALELVPPDLARQRIRRRARTAFAVAAAAAVCLTSAALLDAWGIEREVETVRVERSRHQDVVNAAVEVRDHLIESGSALTTLDSLSRSRPDWSSLLMRLSRTLPAEAFFTSVRGVADTVYLEGEAQQAATALRALAEMPESRSFRSTAPVRRQVVDGSLSVERFSGAVVVDWPVVPVTVDATPDASGSEGGG